MITEIRSGHMFNAKDIADRVRERPFRAFRIVMSSGESVTVSHPEQILISQRFLVLGLGSDSGSPHFDGETRISILHVAALEDLGGTGRYQGNGNH